MRKLLFLAAIVTSVCFQSLAQLPTDGLIAHWTFDGHTLDVSGNGHDAVLSGPVLTNDRLMMVDKAYAFNRFNDDFMSTDIHDSLLANYTAAGWFYWQGIHNSHALGTFLIGGQGWCWKMYENKIHLVHANVALNSTYDIIPYTWFHVAMSYDGSMARLYINGIENISGEAPAGAGENLIIGAIPKYMSGYNWNGSMDEVVLYDRALSSDEIVDLYYVGTPAGAGFDTVTVYDIVPLYDTITVTDTLIIEVNLSVDQPENINTIKVYPNPTREWISIHCGDYDLMDLWTISIVNTAGQLVFESPVDQQELQVNLSDFGTEGLYFIQIYDPSDQLVVTKKIILQ